jgi:hypothetical protein
LPTGHTGSSFFHHVLHEAVQRYPQVLADAALPDDPRVFKRGYGEALVRFEAARAACEARVDIARFIARRTLEQLTYGHGEGSEPLLQYLASPVEPPALTRTDFPATPGLVPEVPFEGRRYRGAELTELADVLQSRHHMTNAAADALRWVARQSTGEGGGLDLTGQRFAVLGAGAELAPTPLLLAAGAEVLWVDLADPAVRLGDGAGLAGALYRSDVARDLLAAPREVAAAIRGFAEDGPVHLCMFAYAAGASQEWRLGAAMNAIARSLGAEHLRSISLFVSPTTAAGVQPEDVTAAAERLRQRPAWQSALRAVGALPTPGHHVHGEATVARAIVSIQGLSYQAAQYVSKICAAESYAVHGLSLDDGHAAPLTVSSNVAGITNTRSLAHPVFQAAFVGAPAFGVQIFEPSTTRALSGLLIFHDLLNPQAPGAAGRESSSPGQRARELLSQQVHGGIYCLPYVLENAIRAAAVIGMARRPSVLLSKS